MKNTNISRRELLQGVTATVMGSPWVVPSTVLSIGNTPPPSEQVRLGHIGVGNQGRHLFRSFQNCRGVRSLAVADAYRDRREACAAMCHGQAYADFCELLARNDIDAVIIATPDHWHVPIALMAARAGKDVYVEKPLGISVEQDLLCRQVFARHNRVFQYGTQQRSSAHCRLGCELVRNGRVGRVHTIEVTAPDGGAGGSTQEIPVPPTLDYDMWLGPAPRQPYTASRCNPLGTYWINDYSIGYLAGWGAHPLDIMVWGSEADLGGPMTFEGTGVIPERGLFDTVYHWDVKVEMAQNVNMRFRPGGDCTTFIGSEGRIAISRGGIRAEPTTLLEGNQASSTIRLVQSTNHYQNFVDAVRSHGATVSPLRDAVRSDIISHLCNIAIRLNKKVTWDPRTERIVNDAEASRMLSRPMRAPWTLQG